MSRLFFIFGFFAVLFSTETSNAFVYLRRSPDAIIVVTDAGTNILAQTAFGEWRSGDIVVSTKAHRDGTEVTLSARKSTVKYVNLRWQIKMPSDWKYLGDAWERAYGDLEWKPLDAGRKMPWYFLTTDGTVTDGYGVKTEPSALCFWTVDPAGMTLCADVRCGGVGVLLGHRKLDVCTIVSREGKLGESPYAAARAFCSMMCSHPRLSAKPVYGFNDWYCAYDNDTAERFLDSVDLVVSLNPKEKNKPFAVVDEGWESNGAKNETQGDWKEVRAAFSTTLTMPAFANEIQQRGARPGLWFRPLLASAGMPADWRLSRDNQYLDPTVAAVRAHVRDCVTRFRGWGYELIKHDFSTYDILGRWGFEMGTNVTSDGWAFADRSRTTAEVIVDFYKDIREAAGNGTIIIGCNTMGHLAAGVFELQRVGDDTSGKEWDRTRKMGVNCVAFRAAQQGTFYGADPDCVGEVSSNAVPWEKTAQWLDLVAHSGMPLFVSFERNSLTAEQELVLGKALAAAARPQPVAEPLDWVDTRTPAKWKLDDRESDFSW